jgi:hypothetical protein
VKDRYVKLAAIEEMAKPMDKIHEEEGYEETEHGDEGHKCACACCGAPCAVCGEADSDEEYEDSEDETEDED